MLIKIANTAYEEVLIRGAFVPMDKIPDEVFSTGVLGTCCGVDPEVGNVYAPIDGKISQLADTLHAVGIEAGGMELLIHVGVDTVDMNGDGWADCQKGRSAADNGSGENQKRRTPGCGHYGSYQFR